MLETLLTYLQREWATLGSAPLTFLTLLVLALGAAYLAVRWRYEAIVDNLRERLETFKERLTAKDEQIGEYRERLHLVPSDVTALSRLSNAELSARSLDLVVRLREFLREREERQRHLLFRRWPANVAGMNEEDRQRAWEQETEALMRDSFQTNADYEAKFKVDSILLRDELLSRLPSSAKNEREYRTYEHPTNPIGMSMVADDLERLAKSLPITRGAHGGA